MSLPKPPGERSARRGSENRQRQHAVSVRLSPAEREALETYATRLGKGPATVLRETALAEIEAAEREQAALDRLIAEAKRGTP